MARELGTGPYRVGAGARGGWTAAFLPPEPMTMTRAADAVAELAGRAPLAAAVVGDGEEASGVVLYRHPSVTHGTPSVRSAARMAATLRRRGWSRTLWVGAAVRMTVVMGLREGYDPDGPVRTRAEAAELLRQHGARDAWTNCAELVSVRRVRGGVQTWREPGVVIGSASGADLGAMCLSAFVLGQQQFVMVDHVRDVTVSLRLPASGG